VRISIFGLGYVGAVSLACLARDGHEVTGVDVDGGKLDLIRAGQSPIVEEGIAELMRAVVESGRVRVTSSAEEAIAQSDVSFVCVGTPGRPNGSQDVSAILKVAEQIGCALTAKRGYHVVVIRSTVEPGTVETRLKPIIEQHSGLSAMSDFGLCFQPEFLREGSSIRDYDHPPFTIVGASTDRAVAVLRELFGHLPCDFIGTSIGTAEMVKYACNAFHALKVAFANEIGRLAQPLSVDAVEVMQLLCRDTRLNISPAYLRPGFAFGGSCLPKDLKALLHMAKSRDVNLPLLSSLLPSNRVHVDHALDMVLGDGRRRVALLGLSFKTGTDDLRESPLVTMAERLIGKGLQLRIYDPAVNLARLRGANKRYIEESIPHISSLMVADARAAVEGSDIVVLGITDPAAIAACADQLDSGQLLLDLVRVPAGFRTSARYQGVAW
jgi:GDP-mannose 6-dehydrogenase